MEYIEYLVVPHQRICNVLKFLLFRGHSWWLVLYWVIDLHLSWFQQRRLLPWLWLVSKHYSDQSAKDQSRHLRKFLANRSLYLQLHFSFQESKRPKLSKLQFGLQFLIQNLFSLIHSFATVPWIDIQKPLEFYHLLKFLWQGLLKHRGK